MTVLLTEDEDFIRQAMIRQIPWQELGIERVLEAESGERALEILAGEKVDIVITDIQMEDVSGLDICRYVSENLPGTKVIIITGYGKLEYAKTAIKYSASYFVLKPIDPEELKAAILDCVAKISAYREKEQEMQRMQEKFHREQHALIEKFLSDMAEETLVDESFINQRVTELSLKSENYYCFTFVCFEEDLQTPVRQREIASLVFGNNMHAFYKDRILFVLYASLPSECDDAAFGLKQLISRKYGITCFLGISRRFHSLFGLSQACHEARAAANLCFLEKAESPMHYDTCVGNLRMYSGDTEDFPRKVAESIADGEKEKAMHKFNDFWKAVLIHETRISQLKKRCADFIIKLYENFREMGVEFSEQTTITEKISELIESNSWKGIYQYLVSLINSAVESIKDKPGKNENIVIAKIRQFIQENLHRTITLEELSGEVYLSPKYVSALVKKHTGSTITDIITEARIEKAKEYLRDIRLKTYEVAEKVGFGDPQYFSQVFKRVTGMTPKDYRKSLTF